MNSKTSKTQSENGAVFAGESVDAYMSIAGIFMDSSEQLTELTLAASREAFDDLFAQSRKNPDVGAALMSGKVDTAQMQPMIERSITYSRNVFQVLMQAQLEAAKIVSQQLIPQLLRIPASGEWKSAVDSMAEGVRDFSERSAKVATAVVESAESQTRQMTDAASKAVKAA